VDRQGRSARYQSTKIAASTAANATVDTAYGTPNPTCRTSAAIVPNTLTMTEASQYTQARYRRTANCTTSAAARPTAPQPTATTGSTWWARKSEAVSPIPVVNTLTTQNRTVTSGTLPSTGRERPRGPAGEVR
jgi:hypothetical protein